jgi:hypothetical protein
MPASRPAQSKRQVLRRLDRLRADARTYRAALLRVFSRKLSQPKACRQYFFDLLVSVSELYLDYLRIKGDMPALWDFSRCVDRKPQAMKGGARAEAALRERFRARLTQLPCWSRFEPKTPFAAETGLNTIKDYLDKFALHLPEIHEEALRLERSVEAFRDTLDGQVLSDIEVGLEHIGRNHISFVHFALEWAADELSWKD